MQYVYKTNGTCSSKITFDINNDVITNIEFTGGCNGNLKAVSKLVNGMTAQDISSKLLGNTCGYKQTSCADQLAKAVMQASKEQNN